MWMKRAEAGMHTLCEVEKGEGGGVGGAVLSCRHTQTLRSAAWGWAE